MSLISVCLCTFRRPQVVETLRSLAAQSLPAGIRHEIVVVDNDAAKSAEEMVSRFARETDVTVRYRVEPRQSISLARNATVAAARGEWLAFIDDDEIAAPNWLAELFACAHQHRADAVLGRVETRYPEQAPEWIVQGRFFNKSLPPTGTPMTQGATCNAMVKRAALPDPRVPFANRFGASGGEDTELFVRMHRQGARLVACREAVVRETIERHRLNGDFLLRRAIQIGENYTIIFFLERSWAVKGLYICRASLQTLLAGLGALFSYPLGKQYRYHLMIKAMLNWGKLRAFFQKQRLALYK